MDKIAQSDWLTLLAIRGDKRRESWERAHFASADEFNRRYLTCQISAILYADAAIGENQNRCTRYTWRFSPGVSPA